MLLSTLSISDSESPYGSAPGVPVQCGKVQDVQVKTIQADGSD